MGGHGMVKKNGQAGRGSDVAQKMLGLCETENGPQLMNYCKSVGTKEHGTC